MADIVSAVAAVVDLVRSSIRPVARQFGYLFHFKAKVEELVNKLGDLTAVKGDVDGKIDVAKARVDVIHGAAERWIKKVEDIQTEVALLDAESQEIDRWSKGWFCDRYSLGKKAAKKTDTVVALLSEGQKMMDPLNPISDPWSGPSPEEQVHIEGFQEFGSTKSAGDKVMEALKDPQVNVVGVHGMGGIGKTTLMMHVSNLVKTQNLFDFVVMVTVSQNADLSKIQDEIAAALKIPLKKPAESLKVRANHLLHCLKFRKRILVILDDLWEKLDLVSVGIPTKEQHPDCKVVITTRRQDVCGVMNTEADVAVGILSVPDAWLLFHKKAGRVADLDGLNEVAREVAQECNGLPIALVTLGSAMRGKDEIHVWQSVLKQLKESDFTDIEDMDRMVYKPIKLSYDYLPRDEHKLCFLFCCLFPEDYKISTDHELLMYVMGEAVLTGVSNWNEGFDKLRGRIIPKLTSSCLLLKSGGDGSVMMHDIVRDVAIIIAKREHGFFVRAGFAIERLEVNNELKKCKLLSLMGSKITKLPEQPNFPNILTLSLSRCQSLNKIPDNFFQGMVSLLTLDLSYTSISSLPESLSCLIRLRSLSLDGCSKLKDASLIGQLKTLETISLRRTSINLIILQQEIQELNVKHLVLERE